jgi:hypothetical protein
MEDAINQCKDGSLAIFSRSGEYRVSKGKAGYSQTHREPIGGTLIVWSMHL